MSLQPNYSSRQRNPYKKRKATSPPTTESNTHNVLFHTSLQGVNARNRERLPPTTVPNDSPRSPPPRPFSVASNECPSTALHAAFSLNRHNLQQPSQVGQQSTSLAILAPPTDASAEKSNESTDVELARIATAISSGAAKNPAMNEEKEKFLKNANGKSASYVKQSIKYWERMRKTLEDDPLLSYLTEPTNGNVIQDRNSNAPTEKFFALLKGRKTNEKKIILNRAMGIVITLWRKKDGSNYEPNT
eukprot:scaffold26739_cov34-Attheya_sp.AAC.1